jgi:hypothetical protein
MFGDAPVGEFVAHYVMRDGLPNSRSVAVSIVN